MAAGAANPYNMIFNNFQAVTDLDLNFYNTSFGDLQDFSTSLPAFSGSGSTAHLQGAVFNGSGDIFVGDTIDGSGNVIGQWVVIPEPSGLLLTSLALLTLGLRQFGRRN